MCESQPSTYLLLIYLPFKLSLADDYIVEKLMIWEYVKGICPFQHTVGKTNESDNLAYYFDLAFKVENNGKSSTKLYDKCDDFS